MGGEFVEEYLQAALEPMIRNIAFDENNEVKLFSTEYMYQGLIGAVTAGLLEAGPTVARNISNGQAGRGVNAARKADELIGRSLALDTKSEAFKLAGKLADGSILRNDYNVGELLKAYRDAGGDMGFMRMPNVDMAEASADTPSPIEETHAAISENNPVNMTDMVAPKMTPAQIVQSVQEEIGRNVAANPEGVQKTLSGGMSALIAIETRIKTESGNINHPGIGIDSAHYEFMGYLRGEMALDTTAWTMAEAIKTVMSTQTLTEAETAQLRDVLAEIVGSAELAEAYVDSVGGVEDNGIRKGVAYENTIVGIPIIDGKVGGKIPLDEYKTLRESSIKNRNGKSNTMTLGRYTKGPDSYIARAGEDSSYFDMGDKWSIVQEKYNLTDAEMFEYFNVPALDYAITSGKTFRFSHNPLDYSGSFLADEWEHIKGALNLEDTSLVFEGGFWYVKQ